eukprot:TRINITY_DN14229_c0_g1_i2.p1 TRINITY_DN14229_c0_g1~~TRINITY_DN14229_c0_g1_i2.p1  ORF type:complete len:272 (-),score=13.23 TRINITY_DN14229_c0_g1_i2:83-898(-)
MPLRKSGLNYEPTTRKAVGCDSFGQILATFPLDTLPEQTFYDQNQVQYTTLPGYTQYMAGESAILFAQYRTQQTITAICDTIDYTRFTSIYTLAQKINNAASRSLVIVAIIGGLYILGLIASIITYFRMDSKRIRGLRFPLLSVICFFFVHMALLSYQITYLQEVFEIRSLAVTVTSNLRYAGDLFAGGCILVSLFNEVTQVSTYLDDPAYKFVLEYWLYLQWVNIAMGVVQIAIFLFLTLRLCWQTNALIRYSQPTRDDPSQVYAEKKEK